MSTCYECNTAGSSDEPLASCDNCSSSVCKTCSDLTSTELRAIVLKKRSKLIVFLCPKCRSSYFTFNPTTLEDSLFKHFRCELDQLSKVLMAEFETRVGLISREVSALKESNIDMIRLYSGLQHMPTIPRPLSCSGNTGIEDDHGADNDSSAANSQQTTVNAPLKSPTLAAASQTGTHIGLPHLPNTVHRPPLPSSSTIVSKNTLKATQSSSSSRINKGGPNSVIIGSKKVNSGISAAKIQRKTSVFVSRLDSGVSSEDLSDYLKHTFGGTEKYVIDEQLVRSGDYRSYSVEIRLDLLDSFLSPANWPQDVLVKKFRFFRSRQSTPGRD